MPSPNQLQEEERSLLKQIIDAYRPLEPLLEQGGSLLQCPTCEQPYASDCMPLERIKVLERILFMNGNSFISGYNLKENEGKVAMPICYDCQTRLVSKHPVVDEDDHLDMSINGYKIYRRSKFGGYIHWVHV